MLTVHRQAFDAADRAKRPARRSREQNEILVFEILAEANGPISAYDIAERATAKGNRLVANQVYRTLARLVEQDLVLRVESLSAFLLKQGDSNAFLICEHCRSVQTLSAAASVIGLKRHAEAQDFIAQRTVIEIHGRCAACADRAAEALS